MGSIEVKAERRKLKGRGRKLNAFLKFCRGSALLLLFGATATICKAQGLGDWFNQAGEQKKYYLQQIAAYQTFESELTQGYGVIQHGLDGIRDINTAEMNLHGAYYGSLSVAGAAVRNSPLVPDILGWQSSIVNLFGGIAVVNGLTAGEQSYLGTVRDGVLRGCVKDLSDLQNVLASGVWVITDEERLKRLAKIHAAMLDKYRFTRSFCNSVRLLGISRLRGERNTQTLKNLYGNN